MAGGSTHYPASSPTAVITPAATYYAFFVGDGTGGTTLGVLYKKDSSAVVTPVVAAAANAFGVVTGTTGTATADSVSDTIAITGSGQASTAATDTPDGLVISVPLLTGPVTSAAGGATSVTANAITNGMRAQMAALTVKGNNTNATANEADLTVAQLKTMGLGALTGWIDVTVQATPVLPSNSAATNLANLTTILTAAAAGSTIYFPGGTYAFNAWGTLPAKQFTFQGQGYAVSGGYTIIQFAANAAGDLITLGAATWYYQFNNMTFTTTVNQTAGALININGNVSTNFFNCATAGQGGFFNDLLFGGAGGSGQSWNSAVIDSCSLSGYKGRGVLVDSAGASLVITNTIIQGAWGGFTGAPAALQATAGIQANNSGAVQVSNCDVLGNINNVLLSPAVGQVNASFFCSNSYFDNSGGSCIKIAGAGATVRVIYTGCSFTTAGTNYSTPGTGFSAVEIGGSFAFGAGGQSISFTDCNILNTFGTTGTSNGVTFTGTWADVYLTGCKVAGWTNGYNIAASGTNISLIKVASGACGPSAGYGANTVGFNVAAGAYKGLVIQGVNAHGNTTNLTLGAVTVAAGEGSLFRIADNTGINPRGAVTTPTFPTSGTTVTNTTGFRVVVGVKGGTSSAIAVNGVAAVLAASPCSVVLDPGGTIAITFSIAPTWVWSAN